jgi:hypothetical protein
MKKLNLLIQRGYLGPVSVPLLILSFIAGWLMATSLFFFMAPGLKAMLLSFFHAG